MKARFLSNVRVNRWLAITVGVLAAALLILSACGGGSSDRAFIDRFMAMWDSNDAAAAQQLFTADAVIYWPEGAAPAKTTGIEEIGSMIKTYPVDPLPLGDSSFTFVPSDKDMELLVAGYKGAHYIACPVTVGREIYMMVLEVRDGKVANQWVSYMSRY
ncbi:MAG: nuclear transport factor 2 family protein [bacterium]